MVDSIVLGLDGANWELLRPWIKNGKLPAIESLRQNGVKSDLESCLPPVTCPNWRCYSTGKNPGKLGVYWWENIDTDERCLSTPTSQSFKSANYWDYLAEDGLSTGVVNLPMTYPPLQMNEGYLIAGGPGSEPDNYTKPTDLRTELEELDYRLHPQSSITSASDGDTARDTINLIDNRLETFRYLLRNRSTDVAHCTIFYINVLQHHFWRGDPTRRAWEVIDNHIGALREEHPDATLYLMSDHGCTNIETVFYVNTWLEQEGFLKTNTNTTSLLERIGINKRLVTDIASELGFRNYLIKWTPENIKRAVPEDEEGAKRDQKLARVDWKNSRAIASGQGLIYLIDGDEQTKREIVDRLSSLRSDVDNRPIARSVHTREEVYWGSYLEEAPTVVFDQRPGVHTSGAIGNNPVFGTNGDWEAENIRTGLFLADGPSVREAIDDKISIMDVAPTILHEHGVDIPSDIDGKPLQLFDQSLPGTQEPIVPDFVERRSDEAAQERLEDLGYLQ